MLSCGGDQDNFYKFQKCQKKQHSQTLEEIKQFQHIKKAKLPKELEFKHFEQLHEELKDDLRNFYQRIQKEKFVKDQKNQKTIIFLSQMQDPEDSTVKTFYNYLQNLEIKKTNLKPFFQLLYFKDMFQNEPQQLKEDPEFLKKYLKNFKKQLFSHFINSENCITLQILDLINEHLIKNFDKKGKLVQPNRRKKVTDKKQKMQHQNQFHQQENRNSVSSKQNNKQNNTQNQEQTKWKSEIQEQQVEEDIEEEIQFKEFKNSLGQQSLNNYNNTASELQQKKDQELLNKIIFGSSDDDEDENNDNKNNENQKQKPFQKQDLQKIFVKPQAKYESDHNYFKQQQTYLSTQEDSPLKLQRKPESDNLLNFIKNNSQEKQKKVDQNFRYSRSYMPAPNINNRQSQQNYKSVFFNKESFITQPIGVKCQKLSPEEEKMLSQFPVNKDQCQMIIKLTLFVSKIMQKILLFFMQNILDQLIQGDYFLNKYGALQIYKEIIIQRLSEKLLFNGRYRIFLIFHKAIQILFEHKKNIDYVSTSILNQNSFYKQELDIELNQIYEQLMIKRIGKVIEGRGFSKKFLQLQKFSRIFIQSFKLYHPELNNYIQDTDNKQDIIFYLFKKFANQSQIQLEQLKQVHNYVNIMMDLDYGVFSKNIENLCPFLLEFLTYIERVILLY